MLRVALAGCAVLLAAAPMAAVAAEKKAKGKSQISHKKEVLACRLGTEDRHARIAIELLGGRVQSLAYYSKWKPRTCSADFRRNDAYSKWMDNGEVTTVTLTEDTGAFLIQHDSKKYHFIFRDVDRMRYCGAEGKINGSLTVVRGKSECVLDGVMDDDPTLPRTPVAEKEAAEKAGAKPTPAAN